MIRVLVGACPIDRVASASNVARIAVASLSKFIVRLFFGTVMVEVRMLEERWFECGE